MSGGWFVARWATILTIILPLIWAAPPRQANQGLQGGWAVDNAGNTNFDKSVVATLPLMQSAGAGWVRINFRLGGCFRDWTTPGCNGKTALETYDAVIQAARQRGLRILGLLSNEAWPGEQTQWITNNAELAAGNGDNDYVRNFSARAALPLMQHFAGQVTAWEVWNEPNAWTGSNGAGQYWGGTFLYPSNFAWLLRHVYEDSRRAGISARIISGGLFGHDMGGVATATAAGIVVKQGSYQDPRQAPAAQPKGTPDAGAAALVGDSGASYLRSTYQAGIDVAGWIQLRNSLGTYPLDGIGQHLYLEQGRAITSSKISAYLQELHDAYLAFEGQQTAKKIQLTEVGWQTAGVDEGVQAQNLRTAYSTFRQTPYVARAYWYAIQDVKVAGQNYGLVRDDGSLKPSFSAFQSAALY